MEFPKYVYKRGTGVAVNDFGLYTAECMLVLTPEALAALDGQWCDSPIEAAKGGGGASAKKDAAPVVAVADVVDTKPAKKVK